MSWWTRLRERYAHLLEEFGSAAVAVYAVLFFGTWLGFWIAISYGFDAGENAANAGTIGGAWVATKVTQPVRIAATIAITPLAVGLWRRLRPARKPPEAPPSPVPPMT